MNSLVLMALIATLGTWLVTALGAATVVFFKSPNPKALNLMLGFAAGVMIAASFWSLLQPAIERAEASSNLPAYFVATVGFLFGACFMWGSDKIVSFARGRTNSTQGKPNERLNRIIMLVLSITLHNIPEGLGGRRCIRCAAERQLYGRGSDGSHYHRGRHRPAEFSGRRSGLRSVEAGGIFQKKELSDRSDFRYGRTGCGVIGALLVVYVEAILPYALSFAAGDMILVLYTS